MLSFWGPKAKGVGEEGLCPGHAASLSFDAVVSMKGLQKLCP